MTGHTPGEWKIDDDGRFIYALNEGGTNRFWCSVQGGDLNHRRGGPNERTTDEELRANALLMRAAPDLLGALRDLIEHQGVEHQAAAGPEGDAEDCPEDDTCRCPIIAQVNAAIAKAEGK